MKNWGAAAFILGVGIVAGCIFATAIDVWRVYPILKNQDFAKGYDVGYRMSFVCQGLSPLNIVEYDIVRDTVIKYNDDKDIYLQAQATWYGLIKDKYVGYDMALRDTIIKMKGKRPDTLQFMGKNSNCAIGDTIPDSSFYKQKPKTKHYRNKKAPKVL